MRPTCSNGNVYSIDKPAHLHAGGLIGLQCNSIQGVEFEGNAILARWTESNEEVMGTAGLFYRDTAELDARLGELVHDAELADQLRTRARQRAAAYSWDRVTDEYEALLEKLTAVSAPELAQ